MYYDKYFNFNTSYINLIYYSIKNIYYIIKILNKLQTNA